MKHTQTYANLLSRTVEAYINSFYYKGYRVEFYQLDFNRKIYRVSKSYIKYWTISFLGMKR